MLHALRAVGDGGVDRADVALVRVVGVVAPRGQHLPLGGVVQAREAGVVELQVAAARLGECTDLVCPRGGEVGPELVEIRVDGAVHGGGAGAQQHHAGRRDGHLRHRRAHRARQETEVVGEDRRVEVQRLVHGQPVGDELAAALVVAELHHEFLVGAGDAAQLVDEVHVPRGAAELAVGRHAQAEVLLQGDDVADRVVLGRAQARRRRCGLRGTSAEPSRARAGAAGCRRARPGTAARCGRPWA